MTTESTDTITASGNATAQSNSESKDYSKASATVRRIGDLSESSSVDDDKLFHDEFDPVYLAKSKVLSDAIQHIGMGKYQWELFVVAGFGWMADNLWPIVTSLIYPQVIMEYPPPGGHGPFIQLAQNLGLLAGAVFWSFSADIIGRRWAFNITFFISGLWGVVAGSSPNFASVAVFDALWSFGVGGNLPVDSAIFLEVLPASHQYLLTVMSIWWAFGQLLTTLIAWGLVGNYSCESADNCTKSSNMGWRYLLFTMGGISLICFLIRFAFFRLYESPKFYLSRGKDELAVEVVHKIAAKNGKTSDLSIEQLRVFDNDTDSEGYDRPATTLFQQRIEKFNLDHIRQVFGTKKLAFSSSLVILIWAIIGLAFPLYNQFIPYFLQQRGSANEPQSTYITYRNTLIIAVLGVPGALIAGLLVELRSGRKGALSLATVLTGVFLFGSTTARTSNALLGWNCAYNFTSNIMYGVLYAYTPEIFPARVRGTAIGLAASANRILGVFSPIIAMYADLTTSAPIYASGALFLASGLLVLILPYEPRGKSSL
uniref:ARAD1C19514p n=1 Tax=Blastobotrys adeninivorans TaxID=409370 RepID=A0A060T1V9_BLAAD